MADSETLTAELSPQGFEPFEGWRGEAIAFCPACTPTRAADGHAERHTPHRVVAYRNPDPIHDGVTWDWREYGSCRECHGPWRLLAHDRET